MCNKFSKWNMSSHIYVNSITVILGGGNEYSKLSERKWCWGFPEQMRTHSQRSLISQLTRLENECMFSKFSLFRLTLVCWARETASLMFLSVLFRNQKLTWFMWEYIYVEVYVALLSLKFWIQCCSSVMSLVVVWSSVFHSSRQSGELKCPMPAHPQNGASSLGQHFFRCFKGPSTCFIQFAQNPSHCSLCVLA